MARARIIFIAGHVGFALAMLMLATFLASCAQDIRYRMPDGVICDSRVLYQYSIEFYDCENKQVYLNPASYAEIKK